MIIDEYTNSCIPAGYFGTILSSNRVVIFCATSFLVMVKAGNYYDSHHAIPDPVARGDDLGAGLFGIYWLMVSLLITAPSSILVCMLV